MPKQLSHTDQGSSGYFNNDNYHNVINPHYLYLKHLPNLHTPSKYPFWATLVFSICSWESANMEDNLNYMEIFTEKLVNVPNLHVFQGLSIF